jgi:hypothetical protein
MLLLNHIQYLGINVAGFQKLSSYSAVGNFSFYFLTISVEISMAFMLVL